MNVAIVGATGTIGSRLVREASDRGHQVTAVVRGAGRESDLPAGVEARQASVEDPAALKEAVAGADAVITAVGGGDGRPEVVVDAARTLLEVLPEAGVSRLLAGGGAGSLKDDDGRDLVDDPEFPAAWKPASLAQRDALAVYRDYSGPVEWTYLSPADVIEPGERTGSYQTGTDHPVRDAEGESRISVEDYAVAMIDELEADRFGGSRFTVGYA